MGTFTREIHRAMVPYRLFRKRSPTSTNYRDIHGLEVRPPDVWRYFVRVKPEVLDAFVSRQGLEGPEPAQGRRRVCLPERRSGSTRLTTMLSGSRKLLSFPTKEFLHSEDRGYAEQVVQYYKLDDFKSHIWIAHQRYPTKGRVWHRPALTLSSA